MAFHRLTTPTYTGGLRAGDDYINNAVTGTPAAADNALGAGVNIGSYFLATNEQITTASINRGLKALANNCDLLDDAAGKTYAVPARQVLTGDGSTTSWAITGPVFMGLSGTTAITGIDGFESFIVVTDPYNNPLIGTNGVRCVVTGVSGGTVGSGGFSSGNLTATITPALPSGAVAHVHYLKGSTLYTGVSGMFSTFPKFRKGPNKASYRTLGNVGTLNDTDEVVFINPSTGAFNFTLATPGVFTGRTITFIDTVGNTGLNAVTLVRAGSENINNVAQNYVLNIAYGRWELYSDGTNWHISQIHSQHAVNPAVNGLRLTSSTGDPIPGSDVTSASTIYLTPYIGGTIALYDGNRWVLRTTGEISLALSGLTSGKNYDVFAYWTGSAVALELGPAWTNDTTRATTLTRQDGVRCKTGTLTRRYVGSIRATGATTTVDRATQRFVYNCDNQVPRSLLVIESTSTWTYTSPGNTWRQVRATTTNKVEFLIGQIQTFEATATLCGYGTAGGVTIATGIGLDNITSGVAGLYGAVTSAANERCNVSAYLKSWATEGYHALNWLECADNTITLLGASFPQPLQTGLTATIMA